MGKKVVSPLSSYPAIQALLQKLVVEVRNTLGEQLVGLYLHGSLAYGDFNPKTSDIDFLIVTRERLPFETFLVLKELHSRLFACSLGWSQKLEGAYIPQNDLRSHNPDNPACPWLGVDGHFALEKLGSDWVIQRWILKEKGVVIFGPPLSRMIDPISPENLRQAVCDSLREWWSPPFPSPQRFESREYRAYAILTMCRSLFLLENGCIASKPEAARWALEVLEEPWLSLLEQALACQEGTATTDLSETFEFIDYTLGKAGLLPTMR
jgi:predicted nucleotidyltransferase